jgi:hypothetical protein
MRVGGVNEAGVLGAIERLSEHVMEKGVPDVELVHGPTPIDDQSQHSLNGGRLDNRD